MLPFSNHRLPKHPVIPKVSVKDEVKENDEYTELEKEVGRE